MTKENMAASLNGREMGEEITNSEENLAKDSGLIVIFGYSDDNIELRGVVHDEVGMYDGGVIHLHSKSVFVAHDCSCEKNKCVAIKCDWDANDYSWFITPPESIPFAPFDILEDGEKFCRGVVIESCHLPKL